MAVIGAKKFKGVIIRNGLTLNSSWIKRVKHWNLSFEDNSIKTKIVSADQCKPKEFVNGTDSIYYLNSTALPHFLNYILSPFVILNYLIKERPDFVLLANGGFLEFYTIPIYCRALKIPLIVDMVDTIGRQFKKNKTLMDYIVVYNKKLFDLLLLRSAHEIFTISTELENKYKSLYPSKSISLSIPSTVDVELFKEISLFKIKFFNSHVYDIFNDISIIKIFYAGTITRLNGIGFFLKALSRVILNQSLNIKIIFAVLEGSIEELIALVKEHNLTEYLVIIPPVEQTYLPVLLSKADILFIPEQGSETANAGFPGKTSEYLMSGKPVITTRFSDLDNYLIDGINACISDVDDLSSYQRNLSSLIYDPEFRSRIGYNGMCLAIDKFSHKDCAMPYIESVLSFYSKKKQKPD